MSGPDLSNDCNGGDELDIALMAAGGRPRPTHTEEATGAEEPLELSDLNERNCCLSSKTWPGRERAGQGNDFRCVHEPVQNPRTE